jgi:quercetin 2,3-dioxygenase
MQNVETLKRGDIQYTTGGTGISHSEYNNHPSEEVHFLQIWVKPAVSGLTPTYYTRHFPEESKRDALVPIVVPRGDWPSQASFPKEAEKEPIPIVQDMRFYASILSPGKRVQYTFRGPGARLGYVQLAQRSGYSPSDEISGSLKVGETVIREGDGIFVRSAKEGDTLSFENVGGKDTEFVWFDMGEAH